MTAPWTPGLAWAAATLLEQLADDPRVAFVTGRRALIAEKFAARAAPDRLVVVPGRGARLSVGAGLATGGRAALVWCEGVGDARSAPWSLPRSAAGPLAGSLVALTDSAAVAAAAWEAGVVVVLPAWPADVAPLLLETIEAGDPVCVHLHADDVPPGPPLALELPGLAGSRTVMHGEAGLVRAAGALVPSAVEAAWHLARRGCPVTLEQITCLSPQSAVHPTAVADGVRVRPRGGEWETVPADPRDTGALAEALASRLGC